jgi:protease-4
MSRRRRPAALAALAVTALAATALPGGRAAAQPVEQQYAEEPTDGIELPATPLAGDHDATATVMNPAGLQFLGGSYLGLALDLAGEDEATTSGPGVGVYLARPRGKILPFALGVGLEVLRPARPRLVPDPGSPVRFTFAASMALGEHAALGVSWHRFFDDGGTTDELSTWDLGLSMRLGNRWAAGAVVRDLTTPTAGVAPVQRRYELELVSRPFATDRLELGLGGRVGEVRADVDGWLRARRRLTRGVALIAEAETRSLHLLETTGTGVLDEDDREWRAGGGFEISFGGLGLQTFGGAAFDSDGDARLRGGTAIVRVSDEEVPGVQGLPPRIERLELSGLGEAALTSAVLSLRAIARDPDVVALFLVVDGVGTGWAGSQELHQEILRVRKAGKKVFAYLNAGSSRDYFVAAAADKIYVDPAGGLRMAGFAGTTMYFKGFFDLIGVEAQFEKIAEYKSAPESYTMTGPSETALRMRNELYDSIFEEFVAAVASARKLTPEVVKQLIDGGPYSAGDLAADKAHRLVDAVATPDELSELLVKELGGVYPIEQRPRERPAQWSLPGIALIYIDGDIVDGESRNLPIPLPLIGGKLVGGDTIATAIAAARADARVDAIVLRINSPGGSAVASELISREVFKTRGVKPIICSMGDLAASGGYYAAAGCDHIFAEPMTITGSIGIFYGKFDLSGMLGKLGVSWETFKRGKNADMESYYRPYTEEERALILDKMRYLYGRFTGAVAEGRSITQERVDELGRGHVYSGVQAKPIDLVDQHGGLADAIAYAKAKVGLGDDDRARLFVLPRVSTGLVGMLLRLIGIAGAKADASADTGAAAAVLGLPPLSELLEALPPSLWVAPPGAAQARLPYQLRFDE